MASHPPVQLPSLCYSVVNVLPMLQRRAHRQQPAQLSNPGRCQAYETRFPEAFEALGQSAYAAEGDGDRGGERQCVRAESHYFRVVRRRERLQKRA